MLETGLGILRGARRAGAQRGGRAASRSRRRSSRSSNEPKTLIVTKANVHVARAPARLSGLYRRQALRRRRQSDRRVPHRRPVHLDRLHALARTIPYLRRKVDARVDARRLRPGQPFRQGAGQRAGELSARRAVPDRRGHALPVRAGHSAARRAAARARAGAARPLRPLRLGAGLRAARALRQRGARRDRRLSRRGLQRALSARSIRSSRKGR